MPAGDHIVIIGRNGAGIFSLRCLAGRRSPRTRRRARRRRARLLRPGARADRSGPERAGQRGRCRAEGREGTARPAGSFGLPSKAADQMPGTLSGGERAKSAWPCFRPGGEPAPAGRAHRQSGPLVHRSRRRHAGAWPGTIVAVSHERGFVEALRRPTASAYPRSASPIGARSTSTTWNAVVRARPRPSAGNALGHPVWVGQSTPSS